MLYIMKYLYAYKYMLILDNVRNSVAHLVGEWRRDGENERQPFKTKTRVTCLLNFRLH